MPKETVTKPKKDANAPKMTLKQKKELKRKQAEEAKKPKGGVQGYLANTRCTWLKGCEFEHQHKHRFFVKQFLLCIPIFICGIRLLANSCGR